MEATPRLIDFDILSTGIGQTPLQGFDATNQLSTPAKSKRATVESE
jgi:hypothetical protein